jgi:hypothetical protein
VLRSGREELLDLVLKLRFILPGVGVLHGERRCDRRPSRLVREVSDGDIRRTQLPGA